MNAERYLFQHKFFDSVDVDTRILLSTKWVVADSYWDPKIFFFQSDEIEKSCPDKMKMWTVATTSDEVFKSTDVIISCANTGKSLKKFMTLF